MVLERLIELQLQFNKKDVTPIVIQYLNNIESLNKYPYEKRKIMSICKVKNYLIKELINSDNVCYTKLKTRK